MVEAIRWRPNMNWSSGEVVGETKMDALADNVEYLYKHTPRSIYTLPGGIMREEGIKIAAGRVVIPKDRGSDTATVAVRFGNFFSVRCDPLITTGVVNEGQARIFCVINGIGGRLLPDARGFNVTVNIDAGKKANDKILKSFYVSWQAVGY